MPATASSSIRLGHGWSLSLGWIATKLGGGADWIALLISPIEKQKRKIDSNSAGGTFFLDSHPFLK